jgi:tRNA pseudouridine38-40 synthase
MRRKPILPVTQPTKKPKTEYDSHSILSKLPKLEPEINLELEQKYLKTQKKFNEKQNDGPRLPNENSVKTERKPKKKVALLMQYCGTGYQGMQINPQVPSIELDLHKALSVAGGVSQDNSMDPQKISFSRCARTDKGVHAAGQVVSLKMILEENIIEKLNNVLPDQIRVLGYCRVNNNFDAKNQCDSRVYEYLLPSYCLERVKGNHYTKSTIAKQQNIDLSNLGRELFEPIDIPDLSPEELNQLSKYRIEKQDFEEFKKILKGYEGTRKFHNFTIGKSFNEKSSNRYIMSCTVNEPFVREGLEWISCKIHGQSFMLHQIRKMIGTIIF